jgi:hypothetical protein
MNAFTVFVKRYFPLRDVQQFEPDSVTFKIEQLLNLTDVGLANSCLILAT